MGGEGGGNRERGGNADRDSWKVRGGKLGVGGGREGLWRHYQPERRRQRRPVAAAAAAAGVGKPSG